MTVSIKITVHIPLVAYLLLLVCSQRSVFNHLNKNNKIIVDSFLISVKVHLVLKENSQNQLLC